ncbi:MAG: YdbH domain-containing protein, partial [Allosphingosinicella sp.]
QVDRLLPPPSGLPFRFPDQAVDLADAAVTLDTPAGRLGIAVEGKGNLADGFRGELAAMSSGLDLGGCAIDRPRAYWKVAINDLRPSVAGPLTAARIACGDFAVTDARLDAQATLAQALDAWRGKGDVTAASARSGRDGLSGLTGALTFDGNARETAGTLGIAAASARLEGVTAARTAVDGRYAISFESGDFSLAGNGSARRVDARGPLRPAIAALASAGGTPVEPIGDALSAALARAAAAFDASGAFRLENRAGGGAVRFARLNLASRSGARIGLAGGDGLTYRWPSGLTRIDGEVAISGGGLPPTRLSLAQAEAGGPIRGTARMAALSAGGARLALAPIRFTAAPGGATRIDTVATVSGPIEDGRVEGLVLPLSVRLDGRGGFALGPGCTTARFATLRIGGLRLNDGRIPLCPAGRALLWRAPGGRLQGGAAIASPRFAGTLGASPIRMAAGRILFSLDGPRFTAADVAVEVGPAGAANRVEADSLTGRFDVPGVRGTYAGLSGRLANVPLLMSQGAGTWTVRDGDVALQGRLLVADAADPPRFYPLVTEDMRLTLVDNVIEAGGWLHDPETGTRVLRADIDHHLRTGEGRARLDVPGIAFTPDFQPEQLTRLTTGIIALVDGTLTGEGEIRWNADGTTSTGTFSTQDMNFAATFGPVEGLTTTVRFTDLLGLVSAPGQEAQVDLIRTGIDVLDGRIRYTLLPGLRVRVEGGAWPFMGGTLLLDETMLDFSRPSARRLTFRVIGVDAAVFVQRMEFSNIAATGTFDGVIPMVFDERGGRIEGGTLEARAPGGTLSYVGELTDRQLGVYGKLAFDALKSLRYSKLDIVLDGSLDGEFVAAIELDGIARDPALTTVEAGGITGLVARRALGQLAKIPFEFNITVRGPFRAVLATMRSFDDPTNLIQSALPEMLREEPLFPTVQPTESENVP